MQLVVGARHGGVSACGRLGPRAGRLGLVLCVRQRGRFFRRILLWGLPVFHAKGHASECRVVFEPSVCEGGGTRPESAEETFADVSRAASQARNMGQQHYDAFWSSMIVLLNGIRSEDLAFRVIQFVVKAWTALCTAEAKLASTLATAGLRAAPSAPDLLALEKARAARVQTAAAARKGAKSRKKVLATVRAATVAAGLAALNFVVAQLPAPPAAGRGAGGRAGAAAAAGAAEAADSAQVVALLHAVPGALAAAGKSCTTRAMLRARIEKLAKQNARAERVAPDELIAFHVAQIARLWPSYHDVMMAIRSPAGVNANASPAKFYSVRAKLLTKAHDALDHIRALQPLAENAEIRKWVLPTPEAALCGKLPSRLGDMVVIVEAEGGSDAVLLAARAVERAREDLAARVKDAQAALAALEARCRKLEVQLEAVTHEFDFDLDLAAGTGHSGLALGDERVLFHLPQAGRARPAASAIAAHVNQARSEATAMCAQATRASVALSLLDLAGHRGQKFTADTKGRCMLLRAARDMLSGKVGCEEWAGKAWRPVDAPRARAGAGADAGADAAAMAQGGEPEPAADARAAPAREGDDDSDDDEAAEEEEDKDEDADGDVVDVGDDAPESDEDEGGAGGADGDGDDGGEVEGGWMADDADDSDE